MVADVTARWRPLAHQVALMRWVQSAATSLQGTAREHSLYVMAVPGGFTVAEAIAQDADAAQRLTPQLVSPGMAVGVSTNCDRLVVVYAELGRVLCSNTGVEWQLSRRLFGDRNAHRVQQAHVRMTRTSSVDSESFIPCDDLHDRGPIWNSLLMDMRERNLNPLHRFDVCGELPTDPRFTRLGQRAVDRLTVVAPFGESLSDVQVVLRGEDPNRPWRGPKLIGIDEFEPEPDWAQVLGYETRDFFAPPIAKTNGVEGPSLGRDLGQL